MHKLTSTSLLKINKHIFRKIFVNKKYETEKSGLNIFEDHIIERKIYVDIFR